MNQQDEQENHFGAADNNPQAQNDYFGGVNEHDQDNIDEGEDQGEGINEGEDQGKGNNNHAQISEDEGLHVNHDDNNNDLNDNQQHDYDSPGDWGYEHDVDKYEDDNDRDPNDIGQTKETVTISRRSHT